MSDIKALLTAVAEDHLLLAASCAGSYCDWRPEDGAGTVQRQHARHVAGVMLDALAVSE